MQGFSWTEIYFGHFVQAAPIWSDIWKFLRTFFQTLIFTTINRNYYLPFSHNETSGSFATISDGKCGLIDWLALYLMGKLELVDR